MSFLEFACLLAVEHEDGLIVVAEAVERVVEYLGRVPATGVGDDVGLVWVERFSGYGQCTGEVFLRSLLDIPFYAASLVLCFSDVCYELAQVVLQHGVTLFVAHIAVVGVGRVQALPRLPCVGHAVAITVGRSLLSVQRGPWTIIATDAGSHVIL